MTSTPPPQQPQPAKQPPPFGPLMHVQPGPTSFKVYRVQPGTVAIHFEHTTGSTSLLVDDQFARTLVNELQVLLGGIVTP
jgi:hypothetical protein